MDNKHQKSSQWIHDPICNGVGCSQRVQTTMLDFIRFPYNIGICLFARMNFMFEYASTKEAVEQWSISECRIQKLCEQKRIEGVVRFGHLWAIPVDAIKPVDGRRKENKLFSPL